MSWEGLLPLLVSTGLLKTKVRSSSDIEYQVRHKAWDAFITQFPAGLEKGWYTQKYMVDGKRKCVCQYFIIFEAPIYKSPTTQLQQVDAGAFAYHQLNHCPGGAMWQRAITAHADTIIRTNYLERVAAATSTVAATAVARITTTGSIVRT